MFDRMKEDIQTVFSGDPAARNVWEILCCYPGMHAIWLHRVAHYLWMHRLRFAARLLSHHARWLTGVDIHPGATIGRRFFIDHGMGVVIGETAEIGDGVLMYQGVVLGGTSLEKKKRHPTIGNDVVIGTGATILGPITVGDGAKIGAGSVVIKPVPAGATIVGVPGHIAGAKRSARTGADLDHARLPDPVVRTLAQTLEQQGRLEERVRELERMMARVGPPPAPVRDEPPEEQVILEALRSVLDPEIGVNIVDLGLIRGISVNGHGVEVHMVTCVECPMAGYLVEQVRRRVRSVTNGTPVHVVLLDDAWTWEDAVPTLVGGDGI